MLGIGVDIEDIKRFSTYSLEKDFDFLKTIYTKTELDYCFSKRKPAKHLAVRFCAKEAFIKALPITIEGLKFNEICITNTNNGNPKINCLRTPNCRCHISLSHDKEKAIAFVVLNDVGIYKNE